MSEIQRPQSPSSADNRGPGYRPEDYNPEMAQASMARDMIARLPTPAIISKQFTVYQGIWTALNHNPNSPTPTYFDTSLRLAVYESAARHSVNIEGALFKNFWAYLMKPTYQIMGMQQLNPNTEDKPGLIRRAINRITGKGQENQPP